jgi:hypothetical protein
MHALIRPLGTAVIILATGGCTSPTPQLDAEFGVSIRQSVDLQLINPFALYDLNPVNGLDGVAAVNAARRYESSFAAPPAPANVFAVGVGSGAALTQAPAVPANQ